MTFKNKVWVLIIVFIDQLLRRSDPWASGPVPSYGYFPNEVSDRVRRQREHVAQVFGLWCQEYDRDISLPEHHCAEQETEMWQLLVDLENGLGAGALHSDSSKNTEMTCWQQISEKSQPFEVGTEGGG